MALDFTILAAGLALLVGGGEAIVRGASSLARSVGISPLTVGLTVVAFGTSAPELAVNAAAALRGSTALSFGNIFGSNMANVGLVLGSTAVLRPLAIRRTVVMRTIPVMLLTTAIATALALDPPLDGSPGLVSRVDGFVLLAILALFLYMFFGDVRRRRNHRAPLVSPPEEAEIEQTRRGTLVALLLAAAGVAALTAGARLAVTGAQALAVDFGVPEEVVGLTLVAIGTSLPELATSLVAAWRGEVDLAVGNVVGSNILNLLLVAGVTAAIRPMEVPPRGPADLAANAFLSVALIAVALTRDRRLTRTEGGFLLAVYAAYLGWRSLAV